MKKWFLVAALVACASVAPAQAALIFSDNFNGENGGVGTLNYAGFANFDISDGTVDLIGNGFFEFPPVTDGHELYVDLDGSTTNSGIQTAHAITLGAGSYKLSFELAGSQRSRGPGDASDDVFAQVFDASSPVPNLVAASYFRLFTDVFKTESLNFTLTAPTSIGFSFENAGGDNIGALLDNVALASVPEPGSMMLLGTGLFGLAGIARRRPRRS